MYNSLTGQVEKDALEYWRGQSQQRMPISEVSGTKLDDAELERKRPARKNMLIRIGKFKF